MQRINKISAGDEIVMKIFEKSEKLGPDGIAVEKALGLYEEEHMHDFLEFVYIISESPTHWIDNKEYKTKHGDLLFINYGQKHKFESDKVFKYVNVLVEPRFVSENLINSVNIYEVFMNTVYADMNGRRDFENQCISFDENEQNWIEDIIYRMITEYDKQKSGWKAIILGYLQVLFSTILRKIKEDITNGKQSLEGYFPDIAEYVERNIMNKITINDIAAKFFYNPAYLGRVLKEHYGKSLASYVKEKRMEKAIELIRTTDDNIQDIIEKIGYVDKKLFYQHFKEAYGEPPSYFRE